MKNKLKEILAAGRPALGTWIGIADPSSVEFIAELGFDWLLIDMEHFPIGKEGLRSILMACKGSESVPIARVPSLSAEHIQSALDLGAQGIMIPMINSQEDAAAAVRCARYPPTGRRGFGPIRASHYLNNIEEYRSRANDETLLFVQIETPEAVRNAEGILATAGIDGVFIGNGDLANFMNGNGDSQAKNVEQIVDRLIQQARDATLPVGLPAWSPEEFHRYVRQGAQLLTLGSDFAFLSAQANTELAATRRLLENAQAGH